MDVGGYDAVDHHHRFGHFSSISILINNIIGPGITQLPRFYQHCGWVLTTAIIVITGVGTCIAGVYLCEAVRLIHGNADFSRRFEYSAVVRHYFRSRGLLRWICTFVIIVNLEMLLIMSIVQSTQLLDAALTQLPWTHHESCGLVMLPPQRVGEPICWDSQHSVYSQPGGPAVLSVGMVLVALSTVPLSLYDLDANIFVQQLSFLLTIGIIFIGWICGITYFRARGDAPHDPTPAPAVPSPDLPAWPSRDDSALTELLGACIFNFNYVFFLPTWANERRKDVGINWGVWTSTAIGIACFVATGCWGAATYAFNGKANDMLMHLANDHNSGGIGPVTSLVFPLIVNMAGIPVISIIIRYNLEKTESADGSNDSNEWGLSKSSSVFIAHILPWILLVPFNTQSGMNRIMNLPSLLFGFVVNFLLPIVLYLIATGKSARTIRSIVNGGGAEDASIDALGSFDGNLPGTNGDLGRKLTSVITEATPLVASAMPVSSSTMDTLSLLPAFLQADTGRSGQRIAIALIVFFTFGTIMSLVYTVRDMFDDGGDSGGGPVR